MQWRIFLNGKWVNCVGNYFFFCKSLIKLSKIHFKLSEEKTQSEIEIAYVWQKLNASFDLNRCKPFVYSSLLSNIWQ